MMEQQNQQRVVNRPSTYNKVSEIDKQRLIDKVINEGHSIKQTAEYLGIKISTAKTIIQNYKKKQNGIQQRGSINPVGRPSKKTQEILDSIGINYSWI